MTDQISFLPMLDDAEHPTWLLNGKPEWVAEYGMNERLKICERIAKEVA